MSADIEGLTEVDMALDGLAAALSPAGRRKLGLKLGQLLRRENQCRIAANVAPDGTAFAPRLRQKGKKARRGKMFRKLRQSRNMQITRSPDEVKLAFRSHTNRLAVVHHFGLRDKVTPKAKKQTKYAARPLLGFSRADLDAIEMLLLTHVETGLR
ncbi:MAG: phage virion morphogenesis protein [Azoarcus sp.]|jgi:phage virion morphogenesis protein|nr:phage virion morphogenesis protein [Azoarcus sp.]